MGQSEQPGAATGQNADELEKAFDEAMAVLSKAEDDDADDEGGDTDAGAEKPGEDDEDADEQPSLFGKDKSKSKKKKMKKSEDADTDDQAGDSDAEGEDEGEDDDDEDEKATKPKAKGKKGKDKSGEGDDEGEMDKSFSDLVAQNGGEVVEAIDAEPVLKAFADSSDKCFGELNAKIAKLEKSVADAADVINRMAEFMVVQGRIVKGIYATAQGAAPMGKSEAAPDSAAPRRGVVSNLHRPQHPTAERFAKSEGSQQFDRKAIESFLAKSAGTGVLSSVELAKAESRLAKGMDVQPSIYEAMAKSAK